MTSMWEKSMAVWRSRLYAFLVLAGAALPAWSQGAIQAITSSQQAGAEVIRVELSEPLAAVPAGFTVQAPPRIAIDLPGVTSALGKPMVEINQGNLRSVSVAQSGERTRLVLNLKQPAGYRAAARRQGAGRHAREHRSRDPGHAPARRRTRVSPRASTAASCR